MAIFHISHIHELYMHNIDKFNLHYKVGKQIIFETSLLEKQILNRSVLTTGFECGLLRLISFLRPRQYIMSCGDPNINTAKLKEFH